MEKMVDEFSVKFTGPALENHTIDVRVLAPSLLALADALKSAQKELSPDSPAPAIDIKATRPGSFCLRQRRTLSVTPREGPACMLRP